MKIVVIIPTYNEIGRIGSLLEEVESVFKRTPQHAWSVVVVDGKSPDGTGALVNELAARYPNIHLITEMGKRGIACAYVTGMRYAIDALGADAFIEFDGDGQHNPEDLTRFAQELEAGFDYVIGSRYVAGGTTPSEWALYRKLLSRFGSLYARLLLDLTVYDATSGFKATRVATLASVLPLSEEALASRNYAYKLQFVHEVVRAKVRVSEIPISFLMRENDISKSAWYDILESLLVTAKLRIRTLHEWRFLRVLAIGATGFVFQALTFHVVGIQLHLLPASTVVLIAGELAVFLNFFLHERFSFRDRQHEAGPFHIKFLRFQLLSAASFLTQWLFVHTTELFVGEQPLYLWIAYLSGIAVGLFVIYAGSFFWVWRKES